MRWIRKISAMTPDENGILRNKPVTQAPMPIAPAPAAPAAPGPMKAPVMAAGPTDVPVGRAAMGPTPAGTKIDNPVTAVRQWAQNAINKPSAPAPAAPAAPAAAPAARGPVDQEGNPMHVMAPHMPTPADRSEGNAWLKAHPTADPKIAPSHGPGVTASGMPDFVARPPAAAPPPAPVTKGAPSRQAFQGMNIQPPAPTMGQQHQGPGTPPAPMPGNFASRQTPGPVGAPAPYQAPALPARPDAAALGPKPLYTKDDQGHVFIQGEKGREQLSTRDARSIQTDEGARQQAQDWGKRLGIDPRAVQGAHRFGAPQSPGMADREGQQPQAPAGRPAGTLGQAIAERAGAPQQGPTGHQTEPGGAPQQPGGALATRAGNAPAPQGRPPVEGNPNDPQQAAANARAQMARANPSAFPATARAMGIPGAPAAPTPGAPEEHMDPFSPENAPIAMGRGTGAATQNVAAAPQDPAAAARAAWDNDPLTRQNRGQQPVANGPQVAGNPTSVGQPVAATPPAFNNANQSWLNAAKAKYQELKANPTVQHAGAVAEGLGNKAIDAMKGYGNQALDALGQYAGVPGGAGSAPTGAGASEAPGGFTPDQQKRWDALPPEAQKAIDSAPDQATLDKLKAQYKISSHLEPDPVALAMAKFADRMRPEPSRAKEEAPPDEILERFPIRTWSEAQVSMAKAAYFATPGEQLRLTQQVHRHYRQ